MPLLPESNHDIEDIPFDAFNLPPYEYAGLVELVNENNLAIYQGVLQYLPLNEYQCVVVVGSDGKKERHTQSKTEFVVLEVRPQPGISYELLDLFARSGYPIHVDTWGGQGQIETKTVRGNIPLSYYHGNRRLVYPDRTLSAIVVSGNEDILALARSYVLSEISGSGSDSKHIREEMEHQLHDYRRAMASGVFRDIETFSRAQNLQYYEEGDTLRFGFKSAFLRATQRKIEIIIARLIRRGAITIHDCYNLPVATIGKLSFLSDRNILNHSLAGNVAYAYAWFLREYHRAQEQFKHSYTFVSVPFDPDEFDESAEIIHNFVQIKI